MVENIDPSGGTARNVEQTSPRDYENKHQLAARLGVSVRTIDNLLKRGLPYVRLTRKLLRFPRVATDQWLAERQVRRS
jgi:excisionase family DNA binding protein